VLPDHSQLSGLVKGLEFRQSAENVFPLHIQLVVWKRVLLAATHNY